MTSELLTIISSLGTPGAAIVAAMYLARELRTMTSRLLDTMTSTIDNNTQALAKVEAIMRCCPAAGSIIANQTPGTKTLHR